MAEACDDAEPGCSSQLCPEKSQDSESAGLNNDRKPGAPAGKLKKQYSVQIKEPPVSQTRGYEVVKVEEKHGIFHNAIPVMPLPLAVFLCVLNIAVPGVGKLCIFAFFWQK